MDYAFRRKAFVMTLCGGFLISGFIKSTGSQVCRISVALDCLLFGHSRLCGKTVGIWNRTIHPGFVDERKRPCAATFKQKRPSDSIAFQRVQVTTCAVMELFYFVSLQRYKSDDALSTLYERQ